MGRLPNGRFKKLGRLLLPAPDVRADARERHGLLDCCR
jgi:hypothetical protein